jgi:hypothetical protein
MIKFLKKRTFSVMNDPSVDASVEPTIYSDIKNRKKYSIKRTDKYLENSLTKQISKEEQKLMDLLNMSWEEIMEKY